MALVQRVATVDADTWYALAGSSQLGNGKGNRLLVGMHFSDAQWRNRFAIRIPRGALFDGIPNAQAISRFDIKLRLGPTGTSCASVGGNVRFFLERATSAIAENNLSTSCQASDTGTVGVSRWPGPGRTAIDRALYSGSPLMGDWITVPALALGRWWFANPGVTELVLVGIAANLDGTGYDETTLARRATFHSAQSSGNAPYVELEAQTNTPPNAPSDLAPADGAFIATTNGTSATVSGRYTDPDGNVSTRYQAQWFPASATDENPGTPTKTDTPTVNTSHNTIRSHTFTGLPARTAGKWRLRFFDGQDWGPWSPLRSATTAYQPGTPAQPAVTPGTLTPDLFVSLVSADPADHIAAAEIIVYQDPAAGQTITKWASGKVTIGGSPNRLQLAYAGTALVYGTQYRWIVRLWNRDGVVSVFTGNLFFTQLEAIGPDISPAGLGTKQNTRTPTFTLTNPGGGNIDQHRMRFYSPTGVLLHDTGIVPSASSSSKNVATPADIWDWGQEPAVDAAIRLTGNANIGPFGEQRQVRINAAPGAPWPLSVEVDEPAQVTQRPDGTWVADTEEPTARLPFRDTDRDLGYVEAPTRREVELRNVDTDAHVGASPYVITSGISDLFAMPAGVLPAGTTRKVRARYDDNAGVRSDWSEYLFVKSTVPHELTLISPPDTSTVTDPTPMIMYECSVEHVGHRLQLWVGDDLIYDSGMVMLMHHEHEGSIEVPPYVLPSGVTVSALLTVVDEDGLPGSLAFTFDSDFSEPEAISGLVLTPDEATASLLVEWTPATIDADEFYAYQLAYRVEGEGWRRIATITDQAATRYRFRAVPHGVDVQVRVRVDNGWAESAPAIETARLALLGYWRIGPSSIHQIAYVQDRDHGGEPRTTVEEFDGPFGGTIVQTWGTAGYRGRFAALVPPESFDLLAALRDDKFTGRTVMLKFPRGVVRAAKVVGVPDTDRSSGFSDVGLSYTAVEPTEADYGALEPGPAIEGS